MGKPFAVGVLRATGVKDGALKVSGQLGGDQPTVLRFLCFALKADVLTELDLSYNELKAEGAKAIDNGLGVNASLTSIDLSGNFLGLADMSLVI